MPLVLGTDYFGSTVSRERSMQLMDHYLDAGGNVDSLQFGTGAPNIDFAANAASLGALSEKVTGIPGLEAALTRARAANRTYLICIETDDTRITKEGGWWWEVAVPEESPSESVRQARAAYLRGKENQKR
jgi:3D-(3,5/4)-trihydroxycyclohexane-1,2-dione acylhydrolase (decyclizing)